MSVFTVLVHCRVLSAVTKLFQLRKYPSQELVKDLPVIVSRLTYVNSTNVRVWLSTSSERGPLEIPSVVYRNCEVWD